MDSTNRKYNVRLCMKYVERVITNAILGPLGHDPTGEFYYGNSISGAKTRRRGKKKERKRRYSRRDELIREMSQ